MSFNSNALGTILTLCLIASLLLAIPIEQSEDGTSSQPPHADLQIESSESNEGASKVEARFGGDDEEEAGTLEGEQGSFFQGDIDLEPDQEEALFSNDTEVSLDESTRTGLLAQHYRWPKNSKGQVVVPYTISSNAGYTAANKNLIRKAMNQLETYTCVRFVERTSHEDYVVISSTQEGCSSKLGRIGGSQRVQLGTNCFNIGIIMHELIHALGYTHMQNHIDRDRYVKIHWDNIEPQHLKNFKKVNLSKYGNFNTFYDYHSVMHYGKDAFAKPGTGLTIVPIVTKYVDEIGQRDKLSKGDRRRINNMYKCKL